MTLAGAVLFVAGGAWQLGLLLWFGRLPGDLSWESGNSRVSVPLASTLDVSIALSSLSWLVARSTRTLRGRS